MSVLLVAFLSLLFLLMMNNEISCVPEKPKSILYFYNHLICVDGLFSDVFILEINFCGIVRIYQQFSFL